MMLSVSNDNRKETPRTWNLRLSLSIDDSICSAKSTIVLMSFAEYGSRAPPSMSLQTLGTIAVLIIADTRSPSGPNSGSASS